MINLHRYKVVNILLKCYRINIIRLKSSGKHPTAGIIGNTHFTNIIYLDILLFLLLSSYFT